MSAVHRAVQVRVVGDHPTVGYAAEELARCLRQLGADVVFASAPSAGELAVGLSESLPQRTPDPVDDPALDDAIWVDVQDGRGVIGGVNPRSVLLAVYRYLTELGYRWLWPGPDGEVPAAPASLSRTVRVAERPSYRHRGVCLEGSASYEHAAAMVEWLPRVGMNAYFTQFLNPKLPFRRWYERAGDEEMPDPAAMMAALVQEIDKRSLVYHTVGHGWTSEPFGIASGDPDAHVPPETAQVLALIDGQRQLWRGGGINTNLCYSTPRVRTVIVDAVADYLRRTRSDIVHLWLADGANNHCECDACRHMPPADFYVRLLNELDERLTADGSSAKVAFLIYCDLLWPPEVEKLANPGRFLLMFAPITRSYAESLGRDVRPDDAVDYPPYERNQTTRPSSAAANLQFLRAWQQNFDGDGFLFDYHLMWEHYRDPGGFDIARRLGEDVRALRDIGLHGFVSCQTQRAAFPTGLAMHVMARTLWDESAKFDEIAADYFAAAFGADGPACAAYLEELSAPFDRAYLRGETEPVDLPLAERLHAASAAIAEFRPTIAANEAAHDGARALAWRRIDRHATLIELLIAALQARARGDDGGAADRWEQVKQYLQSVEDDVQEVFDAQLFARTMERRVFEATEDPVFLGLTCIVEEMCPRGRGSAAAGVDTSPVLIQPSRVGRVRPRYHSHMELCLVTAGAGTQSVNGVTYPLSPRAATLVLPHHIHSQDAVDTVPVEKIICTFDMGFLFGPDTVADWYAPLCRVGSAHPACVVLDGEDGERLRQALAELSDELARPSAVGHAAMVRSKLTEALLIFLRRSVEEDLASTALASRRVDGSFWEVLMHVHTHYTDRISLDSVSKQFQLSRSYLSEMFKDNAGEGFLKYLHRLRVASACGALASSDASVADVAMSSGFDSHRTFARVFREFTGQTPTEYRRRGRQTADLRSLPDPHDDA